MFAFPVQTDVSASDKTMKKKALCLVSGRNSCDFGILTSAAVSNPPKLFKSCISCDCAHSYDNYSCRYAETTRSRLAGHELILWIRVEFVGGLRLELTGHVPRTPSRRSGTPGCH